MATKPQGILFKGEMIRALLNVKPDVWPAEPIDASKPWKWQTRRLLSYQPKTEWTEIGVASIGHQTRGIIQTATYRAYPDGGTARWAICDSPYSFGATLYAKETFFKPDQNDPGFAGVVGDYIYRAEYDYRGGDVIGGNKWKPSIFMPKRAARLWFEVKAVRVERVNAIQNDDAKAEGVSPAAWIVYNDGSPCYSESYELLWDSINGKDSFKKGPWVWVYHLARISPPA